MEISDNTYNKNSSESNRNKQLLGNLILQNINYYLYIFNVIFNYTDFYYYRGISHYFFKNHFWKFPQLYHPYDKYI